MKYKVFLHPKAGAFLRTIDKKLKERIKKRIKLLEDNAELIGKPLRYSSFWSLRIGDYKVIYEINKNEEKIIILFIGHRKKAYSDFTKLF